ncbi:hypothetical protein [Tenacibaculum amylolyticum]|uniref:hypothetical protein n=1 Tax=Tenacibaculum amylolyticum TaxID=104269 RepID=UPI0038958529
MKSKLIKGFAIFAMILAASCSKNEENINTTTAPDIDAISKVAELSSNYINENQNLQAKPPKWLQVAAADIGAFFTAISNGDKFGEVIGAASAASAEKHLELNPIMASTSNDGGNINDINSNEVNAYDNYGEWHYRTIENVIKEGTNYATDGAFDNSKYYRATTQFLIENRVASERDFETFSLEDANERLAYDKELFNKYGLLGSLEFQNRQGRVKENVYKVLSSYFKVVENTYDIKRFVSYSLEVEKTISYSRMNEVEKKQILGVMATARYGFQYWNSIYN